MRPRTKHIALKFHHFKLFVKNKTVLIGYVDTSLKRGDVFIKELNDAPFLKLKKLINGW